MLDQMMVIPVGRLASVAPFASMMVVLTIIVVLSPFACRARATSQEAVAVWQPAPGTTWQWQLSGALDLTLDVQMYDLDLFDTPSNVITTLHAGGKRAVCYVSVGTWEEWRPDANQFPPSIRGQSNGWAGEVWLDIRRLDVLRPLMEARLDLCKAKGFDGVEPDNVDGYSNITGFPLTYGDQLAYNRFVADAAHARGLSVGLKNDVEQVADLVDWFDWTLNEECFRYQECGRLEPFVRKGKAVFHVEYGIAPEKFCAATRPAGFSSLLKRRVLDAFRIAC
jgi:hypothetical protein